MLSLTIVVTIVLLFAAFLFAVSAAEGVATGIAGVVAPLLAQLVKRLTGASGTSALIVSVLVSAGIAVAAMFIAGEVTTFGELLKQAMAVFGIATVVYKLVAAAQEPPRV